MISKKLLYVIVLSLIALPVMAQNQPILKIGIVDADRIIKESVEMQKAYKDLQALVEKKQNDLKRKQEEVGLLEDKYKTQASVLSSEARAQLEEKVRKGYVDLDKLREDSKIEIQSQENAALSKMEKRVGPIIAEIGKAESYSLILRKEAVVYMSEAVDITDKIIKKLNEGTAAPATQATPPPAPPKKK